MDEVLMFDSDKSLGSKLDIRLITFDAVSAARDPEFRREILKMAEEDGDPRALKHALEVIRKATT